MFTHTDTSNRWSFKNYLVIKFIYLFILALAFSHGRTVRYSDKKRNDSNGDRLCINTMEF